LTGWHIAAAGRKRGALLHFVSTLRVQPPPGRALTPFHEGCERLDTADSPFSRIAQDLGTDLRNDGYPDRDFLERRTRDQLIAIARECGYADGVGSVASYKKSELVNSLLRHFEQARAAAKPNAAQQKAREWLPEVMRFPAVDPDDEATQADEQMPDED